MRYELECEDIRELVSALADDELDGRLRKLVSAHLLMCPDCSREAGELMAARGLVVRQATNAEVPIGFMDRMHARLDEVSEVREHVHQHSPTRRMTVIAAAGAIAVSVAIIISTVFFMRTDRAFDLAQLHQQLAVSAAPDRGGLDGFTAVGRDLSQQRWREVRQAIVRINGTYVNYSLYHVGDVPVSVFEGPYAWEPYRCTRRNTERFDGMDVRQVGEQAMTTWQHSAQRYVLTAEVAPEAIPGLTRAYVRSQKRSTGF